MAGYKKKIRACRSGARVSAVIFTLVLYSAMLTALVTRRAGEATANVGAARAADEGSNNALALAQQPLHTITRMKRLAEADVMGDLVYMRDRRVVLIVALEGGRSGPLCQTPVR